MTNLNANTGSNAPRELSTDELDAVNGGIAGIIVAGVVAGLVIFGAKMVEEGILAQQEAWYASR